VSDTVGFIRKLPHDLVEAFKSTLEEVARADLVLHVADASAVDLAEQMLAVRDVLGEIGAGDIPEVLALNKWDLVEEIDGARILRRHPDAVAVSGLTGGGVDRLLERLAEVLPSPPVEVHLLVPFDRPEVVPMLYRRGEVLSTDDTPDGTEVVARVGEAELPQVQEFVRRPVSRRVRG
jgi:GTP-binding protein HflX